MVKIKSKIPQKMKWLFWSYDINSFNLRADKDYIVGQVLNYGTWEDLKWLFMVYPKKEIKEVIKNPRRGVWFENVLRFWMLMFNIKLKREVFERAIFKLPAFKKEAILIKNK